MSPYVIGIDLGGTKVEACLLDAQRNLLARVRRPSEPAQGLDRVCANIHAVVAEAAGGRPIAALGMGTPGTYLPATDTLHGSPHTLVYETPGFITRLRREFALPLAIDNDANCLALAEYLNLAENRRAASPEAAVRPKEIRRGDSPESPVRSVSDSNFGFRISNFPPRYVLAIILGTGFGSGLILGGKLYRGALGAAGEIGHCTVDYQGRLCECGRRGCAEAYLSGSSHTRRYAELTGETLPLPEIYARYESGEGAASQLLAESCRILGEVLANAVNAFDLEAVILGGGVSNLPLWYERVPAIMQASLFGPPRPPVPILQATLGDSAGVLGAACLALRTLGLLEF